MAKFQASHRYKGGTHLFQFFAEDWAEAEEKMTAFPYSVLDGEVVAEIPAPRWFGKLWGMFK